MKEQRQPYFQAVIMLDTEFNAWFQRYHKPTVKWITRKLNGDAATAEDVVQRAWEQLYNRLQKGWPIESFERFWPMLVRRRLIDEIRRRVRRPATLGLQSEYGRIAYANRHVAVDQLTMEACVADPGWPVEELLVRAEAITSTSRALHVLNQRDRLIVIARVEYRLTCRETAELLVRHGMLAAGGNTEKKAENCYYRALGKLRRTTGPELQRLVGA